VLIAAAAEDILEVGKSNVMRDVMRDVVDSPELCTL